MADYQRVKSSYSVREIKQLFGLGERTVRRWTEAGIIEVASVTNQKRHSTSSDLWALRRQRPLACSIL